MTLQELLALLANLAEMSADDLAALEANLEAAAEERADLTTDEAVAELQQIAEAVNQVRAQAVANADADAARVAERDAALAAIRGEADGEGDDTAEGDDAAAADDAAADDADDDAEGDDDAAADDAEASTEEQVAVTASTQRAPRISNVSARRPQSRAPRARTESAELPLRELGLVASANVPGFAAGEAIQDAEKLATVFWNGVQAAASYRHGPRFKMPLVRTGSENPSDLGWDEARILDSNVRSNMRKIRDVTSPQALRASGGICAPSPVQYGLPILNGTEDRPVRDDMLVRFGADRGGVVTLPPPNLTDVEDAITVWTEANDASDTPNPATKNCLEVTCPTEDETLVDAIVQCLQFGNFRARFFAEQIESWMRLTAVQHARTAETRSLTTIGTGSTQVTHGQGLGTILDVLAAIRLAAAAMRNRHRLGKTAPLRFGAPAWLLDNMAVDEARRLPGSGTVDEKYALSIARIESWFVAMNINVTWFEDGETGQVFGPQGDGPLIGWPSTVITYLYPEGSWLFLDGGTLDLGIVRDSTLNSTNDVQMFSETFEATHFHGVESYRLEIDICPDGSVAGTVDFDPCSTGS